MSVKTSSKQHPINTKDNYQKKGGSGTIVAAHSEYTQFSGPVPPPSILQEYDSAIPGSAERILKMAEEQSHHRQELEKMMVEAEIRDGHSGVLFSFILGIGCIAVSIAVPVVVPNTAGAIMGPLFGATGLVSMVIHFLRNTKGKA